MRKFWTPEEDEILKKRFPEERSQDIADDLGLKVHQVRSRAYRLGLKKSEAFYANPKLSGRTTGELGKENRFKKGHEPWLKGKKLKDLVSTETYKAMSKNHFKKGHKSHNHVPIGTTCIRADKNGNKYNWIKIEENTWIHLHRYIWAEAGKSVPEGMIVAFKDRNKNNCTLENLELITREEMMSRNTFANYPKELQSSIRLVSQLNKKIKNATK